MYKRQLIPRAAALCTTGLENFTVQLGLGKWITSLTMTIFYVVLYHIWRERYQIKGYKAATAAIYSLAAVSYTHLDVYKRQVWSRRPGFKYQLWTCIKLCTFIFI